MARKKAESKPRKKAAVPPSSAPQHGAPAGKPKPRARRAAAVPRAKPAPPDLRPGPVPVPGNIPWGYGQTRIVAIARDPSCVFAYWEFKDEDLAAARRSIDAPDAGPVLRVYDTTYRIFDGTNAHSSFDVPVDRTTTRYYLHLNRPATTFIIDIGAKDHRGRFATIARSDPAETPRNSPSGDHRADWMTVPPPEHFRSYHHRFVPRPGGPPPPPPAPNGTFPFSPEFAREALGREGWTEEQWTEQAPDGNTVRWIRWSGPIRSETFLAFPGKSFEKIEIEFMSEPWIVRQERGERRLFGPWNVSVHAWETRVGRQLLQRWTMHSSWVTEERSIRTELPVIVFRLLQGTKTRIITGGSESRLTREAWSSELMLGGASEQRWLGGSELRLAGASETMFLAASEWFAQGASEWMAEASSFSLGGSERWSDYPSGVPLIPPGGEKP